MWVNLLSLSQNLYRIYVEPQITPTTMACISLSLGVVRVCMVLTHLTKSGAFVAANTPPTLFQRLERQASRRNIIPSVPAEKHTQLLRVQRMPNSFYVPPV